MEITFGGLGSALVQIQEALDAAREHMDDDEFYEIVITGVHIRVGREEFVDVARKDYDRNTKFEVIATHPGGK